MLRDPVQRRGKYTQIWPQIWAPFWAQDGPIGVCTWAHLGPKKVPLWALLFNSMITFCGQEWCHKVIPFGAPDGSQYRPQWAHLGPKMAPMFGGMFWPISQNAERGHALYGLEYGIHFKPFGPLYGSILESYM